MSKALDYKDQLVKKLSRNPRSLRGAVDAKCAECTYDPAEHGTWRAQVAACRIEGCPLFAVRPGPTSGPDIDPSPRISG